MKRLQRKRTKGAHLPPGAVYVGRPSIFGNPFSVQAIRQEKLGISQKEATALAQAYFFSWLCGHMPDYEPERREKLLQKLPTLKGKDLACWCPKLSACHADVLLVLANMEHGFCVTEIKRKSTQKRRKV